MPAKHEARPPRRMGSRLTRAELAVLHIRPKELGLDEQVRRDIQREVTGHESCRDMSHADFLKLRRHYQMLGRGQHTGQPKEKHAGASESLKAFYTMLERRGPRKGLATLAQLKKIARMARLRPGLEERDFNSTLRGHTGVVRWQWLTVAKASDMIEALKAKRAQ